MIGGLAIAGTFLVDIRLGVMAWLAAAAHEIPQELGDFGVLLHSGWSRGRALLFNVLSALTFLLGGLIAYFADRQRNQAVARGGDAGKVPEPRAQLSWSRCVGRAGSNESVPVA